MTKVRGAGVLDRAVYKRVSIRDIRPSPRNYKPMKEEELRKEVASVRRHGLIVPLVVRSGCPGAKKWKPGFEIIDGEHRWKALQSLGVNEALIMDIGPVSDAEADEVMIVLNELRGQPQLDKLGALFSSLLQATPIEQLMETMPFPELEMRTLASLTDDFLGTYAKEGGGDKDPPVGLSPTKEWETLKFLVDPETKDLINRALSPFVDPAIMAPPEVRMGVALRCLLESGVSAGKKVPLDAGGQGDPAAEKGTNGATKGRKGGGARQPDKGQGSQGKRSRS